MDILLYGDKILREGTTESKLTLVVLVLLIILILIAIVIAIYGLAATRKKAVVLKKVDYLIEDITYKSESLNVSVETINKMSNYVMSIDSVSQKGFKQLLKFISENRNYIFAILEKLRSDVENDKGGKKKTTKKVTAKKTTKKAPVKKTAAKKAPAKKTAAKKAPAKNKTTKK